MGKCIVCGDEAGDHPLTYNTRGEQMCVLCAIDDERRHRGFVGYWLRVKTTSEHGREINRDILESVSSRLDQLEDLARELYGPGYNREVLKKRAEVRDARFVETREAHNRHRGSHDK